MKVGSPDPTLKRVVELLDKDAAIKVTEDGRVEVDAAWSVSRNWAEAKTNFALGTAGAAVTGLAWLQYEMAWLDGAKVLSVLLGLVAGGAGAWQLAKGVANTGQAAAWAVVAGCQRLFGRGAPVED